MFINLVITSLIVGALETSAFTPTATTVTRNQYVSRVNKESRLQQRMVATTPADLGISSPGDMNPNNGDNEEMDLEGIAFSVSVQRYSILNFDQHYMEKSNSSRLLKFFQLFLLRKKGFKRKSTYFET